MRFVFAFIFLVSFVGSAARAATPDYRPSWSTPKGVLKVIQNPNSSVLDNPQYRDVEDPNELAAWLNTSRGGGHANLEKQFKEEWIGIQDHLEARERHHLMGQMEEIEASQRGAQLGKTFLRSLFATRIRESLQRAEKKSDTVRVFVKAQQKIDFIAQQGMRVDVGPQLKFGSRADFVQQRGRVWMESPWLLGTVDFQFGTDPTAPVAAFTERYQISLSRALPWQLHSGLVYGGTSQVMTTSLSKPLLNHLSCTVENRQNFNFPNVEQLARFNYQIRF